MMTKTFNIVFLLLICFFSEVYLFGYIFKDVNKLGVEECLLPKNHPLQKQLKNLFLESDMFESPDHFRKAGFKVIDRIHKRLMVASHPTITKYLFKKFQNGVPQREQLENYLTRISGARFIDKFIKANRLEHLIVPKKWLYILPKEFSDCDTTEKTYILIVEKMDICSERNGMMGKKYHKIDLEILEELCVVAYYFRSLDSIHNLPFTHENKIAFIDTEKWKIEKNKLWPRFLPWLAEDKREYALGVFKDLRRQNIKINLLVDTELTP